MNKHNLFIAIILYSLSNVSFATTEQDKKIDELIGESEKIEQVIDREQDNNCSGYEELKERIEEENGKAITLKVNLIITNNQQEIILKPGYKISYLSRVLRKKDNEKVRVKYISNNAKEKGSGYINAGQLKELVDSDNIIPKSCL